MHYRFLIKPACLFVISVLIGACGIFSSSGGSDRAYLLGEYSKAAQFYKKAYTKEKNKYLKGEIAFKMAECYRLTNKPTKAVAAYSKVLRSNYENPLTELFYAQSLLKSGKTELAKKTFEEILSKHPTDAMAHVGLASCEMVLKGPQPSRFQVTKLKELNSKFSDYSPVYGGTENDVIYFSSMRHLGKKKGLSRITGQGPSDLYSTRPDSKGKWMDPEPLEEPVNSIFEEGAACMGDEGKTLYYTRCKFDKTKAIGAEILKVERSGGQWGDPSPLSFCADSLLTAHPAVSIDNSTIYFVSDMEGGIGGKDLWKATLGDGGSWSKPENLGEPINTKGDEMFPTVRNDGVLYFSSDGHAGYGGLDIFRVETSEDGRVLIRNMGMPINSIADDFGLVFRSGKSEGMFSSSRDNVKGIDNLFSFTYREFKLSVRASVFDEKTKSPLTNAKVKLIGSDGTNDKPELNNGSFALPLKPNTDYVFMVAAPGFLNQRVRFSTGLPEEDKEFVFEVPMVTKSRPVILEDLNYTSGGFHIDAKMAASLDHLYNIMADNPTLRIEIASHTDASGDETENLILSQKRAESIMEYLFKKGIAQERITAKGYGESQPVVADKALASRYRFLKEGDILNEAFIARLNGSNKELANQMNRRTEFKVVSE